MALVETEVKVGARTRVLALDLRQIEHGRRPAWLFQRRDLTRQKEAEYRLDSDAKLAEKNARELTREKERGETLLFNIMPKTVYPALREFGRTTSHQFGSALVLMLDFVGCTEMAASRDPASTIAELKGFGTKRRMALEAERAGS